MEDTLPLICGASSHCFGLVFVGRQQTVNLPKRGESVLANNGGVICRSQTARLLTVVEYASVDLLGIVIFTLCLERTQCPS